MNAPAQRLLRNARREAVIVLCVWAVFIAWVVGYSWLRGYERPPDGALVEAGLAAPRDDSNFRTVLGIPDWVFHGIALPWLIAVVFTLFFGMRTLRDDDLGEERDHEKS